MKKVIIPSIVVVLLISAAAVFSALHPAPKVIIFEDELHKSEQSFNKTDVKFLNDIGFGRSTNVENNLPVLYEDLHTKYMAMYGLEFIGDKVITRALQTSGLIIGRPDLFTGTIPAANISEMQKNLLLFPADSISKDSLKKQKDFERDEIHVVSAFDEPFRRPDPKTARDLYIIASDNEFDLRGMGIDPHSRKIVAIAKDPMILLKVPNGYLKLTSWN